MSESSIRITLAEAVDRYRREPGAYSNAYDWYRKQAQRYGRVSLGGSDVTAVKVGRQWMVEVSGVERALAANRESMAERHRATEDYKAHVLHGGNGASASVRTDWGGYRISGDFHFAWNDYAIATKRSDGSWYCNSCFKLAQQEHEREECHTCRDWGSCGGDCTLSRIFCTECGTSRPM